MDTNWAADVQLELKALKENHTWDVVELPIGKMVIGCKWVFNVKYNSDSSLECYKPH